MVTFEAWSLIDTFAFCFFHMSEPSILLKMKEIRKVVLKLSRDQKFAAGGGGGARDGVKTVQKQ